MSFIWFINLLSFLWLASSIPSAIEDGTTSGLGSAVDLPATMMRRADQTAAIGGQGDALPPPPPAPPQTTSTLGRESQQEQLQVQLEQEQMRKEMQHSLETAQQNLLTESKELKQKNERTGQNARAASLATGKESPPAAPNLEYGSAPPNKLDVMSSYYDDMGFYGHTIGEKHMHNGSWFWAPNHPKPFWLRGCKWVWVVDGAGNKKEKCIPLEGKKQWGWTDPDHYRWRARHRRRGTWMHLSATDWIYGNHKLETFAGPHGTDEADEVTTAVHSRNAMGPSDQKNWRDNDQGWLTFQKVNLSPGAALAPKHPSLLVQKD